MQTLLGLPDSTANPHLWYRPRHDAGGREGGRRARWPRSQPGARRLLPGQRERASRARCTPWYAALHAFAAATRRTPVATTEPVARLHARGGRRGEPDAVDASRPT